MNTVFDQHPRVASAALRSGLLEVQRAVYRASLLERPLTYVQEWLLDRRNLFASWQHVSATKGANTPGSDGVTCTQVRVKIRTWLDRLATELAEGRYRPAPLRWFEVPKADKPGSVRRLGIPTVRDRVVATCLKQVLEPVLDPIFLPGSFGFRPGRSVTGALQEAVRRLTPAQDGQPPFTHAAHLDIAQCFDTVDHATLRAALAEHVGDPFVLHLLDLLLEAGETTTGWGWWRRRRALVQGSSLSPLLCNLALHSLDRDLDDLASQTRQRVVMLRYADDLLLLADGPVHASRGLQTIRRGLRRLHQRLGSASRPRSLDQGVDWLGVILKPFPDLRNGRTRFGYIVPDQQVRRMLERLNEITVPPSDRIGTGAFRPAGWLAAVNVQLGAWHHAYRFAENFPEVSRVLDERAWDRVGQLLQRLTGKHRRRVVDLYARRLPRGYRTWEIDGTALTVLGALPPQVPKSLTRRPLWMSGGPR